MMRYYKICKRYFKLHADHPWYLTSLCISAILRCVSLLTIPIFIARIIDCVTIAAYQEAFMEVLYLAINYLLYNLFHEWNYITYAYTTCYVYTKLQRDVIDKISTYNENFTKKISKAHLLNVVSTDILETSMFTDRLMDAIAHIVELLGALGILLFYHFYIGLLVLCFTLLYQYLLAKAQERKDYWLKIQCNVQDQIVSVYDQVLDGLKEVKSFDMNMKLKEYMDSHLNHWHYAYSKRRRWYEYISSFLPALITIAKIITYFIIVVGILKGNMTIGSLVLIISYVDRIEAENQNVFSRINAICVNSIHIERIYKVLYYQDEQMVSFGNNVTDDILGIIDLEHVSFVYEKEMILNNINIHIEPHTLTAIVGKSGSGKSTIFRLLLRLYKPSQGHIFIDGVDIFDYKEDTYAKNISITTQKPFIFNMSIRENLNLVDTNKKRQEEVCKRVGIHDFIMGLPQGYNTILKEDGTNISGGQKQLISLARTLLSTSEILLFDEVTSNLDPNTEIQVMNVLKDLKKDHTVLIITHKPQIMRMVDQIVVINKGKVVGKGTHRKLLEKNKYYQRLQK